MSDTTALTVEDVARKLQLTPGTVRRLLRLGKLRGVKTSEGKGGDWRVSEASLAEYLRGDKG